MLGLAENADVRLLPYSWLGLGRSLLVEKVAEETKHLKPISNGKATLFYKDLDWDSKFFGVKSGEIPFVFPSSDATVQDRIDVLRTFEEGSKYEFTTLRVNALDMATAITAEQLGYYLTDVHISYYFDKRKQLPEIPNVQYSIRKCPCNDKNLSRLAKTVFSVNFAHRFHNDPNIPRKKADELYVRMTEHCLKTHSSVIVAESGGIPISFLTLQEHADCIGDVTIGKFGLAGVSPEYRGKGIYQNMILQGLHTLQDDIVETTNTVITNPVQRAWMNLKFKPSYVKLTFHKWKTNNAILRLWVRCCGFDA